MLRDRFKSLFDQWRALREVQDMTFADLADLDISLDQLEKLVRMTPAVPDRMMRMAQEHGLTPDEVRMAHAEFLDMLNLCDGCAHGQACTKALKSGAPLSETEVRQCPNAAAYRELATARLN